MIVDIRDNASIKIIYWTVITSLNVNNSANEPLK